MGAVSGSRRPGGRPAANAPISCPAGAITTPQAGHKSWQPGKPGTNTRSRTTGLPPDVTRLFLASPIFAPTKNIARAKMPTTASFTYFRALPPEPRLQIWEEALSVPSVWAAVYDQAGDGANRLSCAMTYVGPAPWRAGLASQESWRVLMQSGVKPIRGPTRGLPTSRRAHWVHLDRTVVYLGDPSDAEAASLCPDELPIIRHFALLWCRFDRIARTCQLLA